MEIKHIFFDLDHTLWDFEKNAQSCLVEIFETHRNGFPANLEFVTFLKSFSEINKGLWQQLDLNQITHDYLRTVRFQQAFANIDIQIAENVSLGMNEQFLELLPQKTLLIEGTLEILEYLSPKYELHIISNGYQEVQNRKMKSGGIHHFFQQIITNEVAGARKPDKAIFEFALNKANATFQNSIMIGDNLLADIEGAKNAGLKAILFDEFDIHEHPYKINSLLELKELF